MDHVAIVWKNRRSVRHGVCGAPAPAPTPGEINRMPALAQIVEALEQIAPLRLAADWDAVGLLVDGRRPQIARVLTCLSLTPAVAAEAVG
ncbi:MAG: Nif3-like dinuclear metal center hexameric protein, partial [Bacteroidota bacterium]